MKRFAFVLSCTVITAACAPSAPNTPMVTHSGGDSGTHTDAVSADQPTVTDGGPMGDGAVVTDGGGACTSALQCPAGQECERSLGRCVGCITQSDCPPMEVCSNFACTQATTCQSSRQCENQVCDTPRGVCVDCVGDNDCMQGQVCRANVCVSARQCQSSRQCNDQGQVCATSAGICVDCLADADCETGTYCATGGVCRRQVCSPNARECIDNGRVRVCDARGTAWREEACGASQTCDGGQCRPWICQPNVTVCGSLTERRTCNENGLGFTTAACGAQESCDDGQCRARTCTAGATRCSATGLREVCSADGLGYRPMPCTNSQTCREGTCLDRVCVPGQATCSVSGARQVCNADGLGFTTTPCESMQSCLSGVCRAWACTPGASACADSRSLRVCAADGLSSSIRSCGAMQTCSSGMCSGWVCVPSEATCPDAHTRRVCNSDGLGYTSQACSARQSCSRGACEAWLCTPTERSCEGTTGVRTCAADGLSSSVTPCAARQSCTNGACTTWACTPGDTRCSGTNAVETCRVDGLGYTRSTCTPPAHATSATCTSGACVFVCEAGYVQSGGACVVLTPPRPIAPSSGASTGRRPVFRWANPDGVDGAVIQLCRDRACTMVTTTYAATGTTFTPPSDLPDGRYFWRLFPRVGASAGTMASVVWSFSVTQHGGVSNGGPDVNGDGYADMAVGAYYSQTVEIHLGSATGPTLTSSQVLNQAATYFGRSLAWLGDVNGDGNPDLAVGSYTNSRVYVYYGNGTGLPSTPTITLSNPSLNYFGISVAGAGDVNGDGYSDVIVGSSNSTTSTTMRAVLYLGSATGLSSVAAATIYGTEAYAGYELSGLGDVNGDGYGDVAVGSYSGSMRVYYGRSTGLDLTGNTRLTGSASNFGASVAGLGDSDGDGYADLVVGSYTNSSTYPRVSVFRGSNSGISSTPAFSTIGSTPYFGNYVSGAGDVNGDGFADLAASGSGGAYAMLYFGSMTGFSESRSTRLTPSASAASVGPGLANVGDVNGDGFADVAVGDYQNRRVFVFSGSASGVQATPSVLTSSSMYFGYAVARHP